MADEDGWAGPRRHDEQGLGRLLNIIRAQEQRIAALERGAPLRAAGISASPDGLTVNSSLSVEGSLDVSGTARLNSELQVRGQGRIRAYYPGTDQSAAYFGDLTTPSTPEAGAGIATWEPGGNVIMVAKSDPGGDTHSFGVRDNSDREVLSVRDDTPRGLSRPAFTINCGPRADYTVMPGSDSGSWTPIYEGGAAIYSPRCNLVAQAIADESSTQGQARLVMSHDGTDRAITTRTDIGFGYATLQYLGDIPSQIPIGAYVVLQLQVRRTSGSGKIRGSILQSALIG